MSFSSRPIRSCEAAAPSLGLSVTAAEVRNPADIERVLSSFGQEGGGLIVTPSALPATRRDLLIGLAARLRSAGERPGRQVRALEVDPTYVDVAVRRWQHYTGKSAVLAASGETFETIEEQRAAKPAAA